MTPLTTLPTAAGIGLRAPHYREALAETPPVAWWEVHSENFFAAGGNAKQFIEDLRSRYPISLHGVGASLGGLDTLFEHHLERLHTLVQRIEPAAVSEHLCWSSLDSQHFNDLLPLPYTHDALQHICARIERMQEKLGRRILVENVSSYVQWKMADFSEWDFLVEVAQRSGCGILLDLNNIFVSARNHGYDPQSYLQAIPPALVGELHLAGFDLCDDFLVDTHGRPVQDDVWALYDAALKRFGALPTLVEWDTDIPALERLQEEATKADRRLQNFHAKVAYARAA